MLHIGDIHYNHIDKESVLSELKDKQVSRNLAKALPERNYKYIIEDLLKEMGKSPTAILFSGDLSTKGLIGTYKECLRFLRKSIPDEFFTGSKNQSIFIAPGNHDIDRTKFTDEDITPKFRPMIDALKEIDFPEIPLSKNKVVEFNEEPSGKILIIVINSCIGCGERRYYPEPLQAIIAQLQASDDIQLYEDIDTPMFNTDNIKDIVNYIKSTDDKCLPIILTHHNLLTMRKPRVEMYTELLNSGYMRESLLGLGRPILYLHGHIHDNPVEIIQSGRNKDSKIICISAPLLLPIKDFTKFGYNTIKIHYSQNKNPLGCEIIHHEFIDGDHKRIESRIRFRDPPNTLGFVSERGKKLLELIKSDKLSYLGDLLKMANEAYGWGISEIEIEKLVDELDWLGLVEYFRNNPTSSRAVHKVIP